MKVGDRISFFYPGVVVPQGRPRAARIGRFIRMHDDPKSHTFKVQFANFVKTWILANHADYQVSSNPLRLELTFALIRPKSVSIKKRPMPTAKPDIDNLVKSVTDACKEILWHDDSQIVDLAATKIYSDRPGVTMVVGELVV